MDKKGLMMKKLFHVITNCLKTQFFFHNQEIITERERSVFCILQLGLRHEQTKLWNNEISLSDYRPCLVKLSVLRTLGRSFQPVPRRNAAAEKNYENLKNF